MASIHERTAYIYCVPDGASKSDLISVLNSSNQSDCSIHVNELKKGVAVVKILGNVSWSQLSTLCDNHNLLLLPDVTESASVHINSEWVKQIRDSGLKFNTIVKRDITITEAHGDVILKGQLADVNLAISDIKDAVAKSICDAFDSLSQINGSSNGAVDRSSDYLNPNETDHDERSDESRLVSTSATLELCKIPEHVWRYLEFRYPEMQIHWKRTLEISQNYSTNVTEMKGNLQDVINFDEWYRKHNLTSIVQSVINVPSDIDVDLLKTLVGSSEAAMFKVYVRFVYSTKMECIGKDSDIDGLITWLKRALNDSKDHKVAGSGADVEHSVQVNGSYVSSPVASASAVTHTRPVISFAGQERLKFKTAESELEVEVLKGDLTRQKTHVIVNPANKNLFHCGGAAKAIQTAAGSMLITECKEYIRKHKELSTSSVMHTTSGNLPRPISYVIHACGPNARDHPDYKQCFRLLEKTFLNCFTYANDTLHVKSLALPAISSGTFSVPFDIVANAAFSALTMFDSYMSQMSPKKRHLSVINFVNIDKTVTEQLIAIFTMRLRDSSQHMPPATGIQPMTPADTKSSSDDNSFSKKSSPRNVCCVCGKPENSGNKFTVRVSCSHRCCVKCKSQQCIKCHSLPHSVAHSRKAAETQISPRDVDPRAQSTTGVSAVNGTGTNYIASSPSPPYRSRSRSHSFRGYPRSDATDTSIVDAKADNSNSKHEKCEPKEDEFTRSQQLRRSSSLTRDDRKRYSEKRNAESCVICMDEITNPKKLECGHTFCADCIEEAFAHVEKCPCCGRIFGKLKGNQPTGGTMKVQRFKNDLDGYRGAGSLVIKYDIPSGFQQANHPNPGKPFKGTRRTAYLPATAEGEEICKLLREAFNAGLTFTIGKSHTTGENNVVIWNDIHHKTNKTGQYGYPDFTYLSRVRSELAAKGIRSTSSSSAAMTDTALAKQSAVGAAVHSPVTTHVSKSSTSSHEPAAAAAGRTAVYHNTDYDMSSRAYGRHTVPHTKAANSSLAVSATHNTSRHGTSISTSHASNSSYAAGSSNVPYYRDASGSVSSADDYSSRGRAAHSSRRDDYTRQQQASGVPAAHHRFV